MAYFARAVATALTLVLALASPAVRAEDDKRTAAGIKDNSFLIEEAYNQDAGVVQHINTLRRQGRDWFYVFTQEWPLGSEKHQVSYSIPYSWLRLDDRRVDGFGDIFLNYRYQLMTENGSRPAIAPRFSLILPTGDRDRELGQGGLGWQVNIPVSRIVSDRVSLHFNAGATGYFDIDGHHPLSFNLGGSIVYAVSRDFNVLLEAVQEWNESVSLDRLLERERSFTLSPGARFALNYPGDLQVVLGAAAPIRFIEGGGREYGVFLYLSIEHPFQAKAAGK